MNDAFAYDVVEYPSYIHPQMHPSRLAAIARLHGIAAASPGQCRLLEIGCGDGLQLLTLAQEYPESRFVGVDLSQAAIARGEALRRKAGLDNLSLVNADLLTWDPGADGFDYVLAHGFFSWVPDVVRERLLALCDDVLTPTGVAYISYNALPGGHLRRMIWQMLAFHVDRDGTPEQQVSGAADFLAWLDRSMGTPADGAKEGYLAAIRYELDHHLKRLPPALLFHDDLSPHNTPFLFSEFMTKARSHGLDYLAEADYFEMSDLFLSAESRSHLDGFTAVDRVAREQYLDFLKGRRFRQTLLHRADAASEPDASAVLGMEVIADLRADPVADANGTRFSNASGAALVVSHPLVEHVFSAIASTGQVVGIPAIRAQAAAGVASDPKSDEDLANTIAFAFRIGLLALSCDAPTYATEAAAHPRISKLSRAQLERGDSTFASLRPAIVRIQEPPARELMRLLDGSRDRLALLEALLAWQQANPETAAGHELTPETLEASLAGLANLGMLVAD
jgi:SAM-dependent methyltransferase